MRPALSTALPVALGCCLAGCAAVGGFVPPGGVAQRCGKFMVEAYPDAAIDVIKSEVAATSLTTIVARVEGVRTDLPPHGAPARFVAVECRFDSGILTGFHWTKGPSSGSKISLRGF